MATRLKTSSGLTSRKNYSRLLAGYFGGLDEGNPLMDGEVLVMAFGGRVRQARLDAGLDQATLAGRLGVGIKTIYNWEHELTEPTPDNWARLALELQRTVRWFKAGEESNSLESEIKSLRERIESLERKIHGEGS